MANKSISKIVILGILILLTLTVVSFADEAVDYGDDTQPVDQNKVEGLSRTLSEAEIMELINLSLEQKKLKLISDEFIEYRNDLRDELFEYREYMEDTFDNVKMAILIMITVATTILGFLGYSTFGSLKATVKNDIERKIKKTEKDLEELNLQKEHFEKQFKELERKRIKLETQIIGIDKFVNKKIKILIISESEEKANKIESYLTPHFNQIEKRRNYEKIDFQRNELIIYGPITEEKDSKLEKLVGDLCDFSKEKKDKIIPLIIYSPKKIKSDSLEKYIWHVFANLPLTLLHNIHLCLGSFFKNYAVTEVDNDENPKLNC